MDLEVGGVGDDGNRPTPDHRDDKQQVRNALITGPATPNKNSPEGLPG